MILVTELEETVELTAVQLQRGYMILVTVIAWTLEESIRGLYYLLLHQMLILIFLHRPLT
jgi:hypothetical protein